MKTKKYKRDATLTKRVGAGTTILGFLSGVAGAVTTFLTTDPVFTYTISSIGVLIGLAGAGVVVYGKFKENKEEKTIIELNHKKNIMIPERDFDKIDVSPRLSEIIDKLQDNVMVVVDLYVTIDKNDPSTLKIMPWIEKANKRTYKYKEVESIEV